MPRKRYPKITKGADGLWHAWITVGTKPNGRPDQRHIKRGTKTLVEDRIDEVLDDLRNDAITKPGRSDSVEGWLTTYLDTVLPSSGRCDPGTIVDYRSKLSIWVYPVIGRVPLRKLQTDNLEEVYLRMRRAGRAGSTVLKVHRILSRALEVALRRRLVGRNVAKLMDAPQFDAPDQTALNTEDAAAVLAACADRRHPARWSIALALGLRQGEALGLRWSYVDLDRGELRVWWQLRRRAFQHGCGGSCGRQRGGYCPQRVMPLDTGEVNVLDLSKPATADRRTGFVLKRPKGGGKRTVALPDELVEQLRARQKGQEIERVLADVLWQEHDLVFTMPDGRPIDPKYDHQEWKEILVAASVPATRLHNARHTAGTIMTVLGVPVEVVQEVLGHSDIRTTRGYVHVASEMARSATARMGRQLLAKRTTPSDTPLI